MLLPDEINRLIEFMKQTNFFVGSNTDFAEDFSSFCGKSITPSVLTREVKGRFNGIGGFVSLTFE